jgi:hypothetical protein
MTSRSKRSKKFGRFYTGFDILNLGRENKKGSAMAEPFVLPKKSEGPQPTLEDR